MLFRVLFCLTHAASDPPPIRNLFHAYLQSFVIKVGKADQEALAEAGLFGVKKSKNCVEVLTSDDDDDDVDSNGEPDYGGEELPHAYGCVPSVRATGLLYGWKSGDGLLCCLRWGFTQEVWHYHRRQWEGMSRATVCRGCFSKEAEREGERLTSMVPSFGFECTVTEIVRDKVSLFFCCMDRLFVFGWLEYLRPILVWLTWLVAGCTTFQHGLLFGWRDSMAFVVWFDCFSIYRSIVWFDCFSIAFFSGGGIQ